MQENKSGCFFLNTLWMLSFAPDTLPGVAKIRPGKIYGPVMTEQHH